MDDQGDLFLPRVHFDGRTYEPAEDFVRLTGQNLRVFLLMRDGQWRTLTEIEGVTDDPQASISARLRDLRKVKFGAHTMDARRRGGKGGTWEYRVTPRVKVMAK